MEESGAAKDQSGSYSQLVVQKEVDKFARAHALSNRERDVFCLLLDRMTSSEAIAGQLSVSRNTVRNHFQNIFAKTKTRSKTDLLAVFFEQIFGETTQEISSSSDRDPIVVLYGEDDQAYATMAKRAFVKTNLNGKMILCKDGQEVLSYLRREGDYQDRQAYPEPQLILLDLGLPKMDGLDVLSEIRADRRLGDIPVVALTGSNKVEDVAELYRLGGNSFIPKPIGFRSLVSLMETIVSYWTDAVRLPSESRA